jgi:anti-sigma factor RsiW
MTCSDVRKVLSDLALGDLDAEPAADLAAHLKSCAECRDEEAAVGRTLSLLKKAPVLAASTERRAAAVAAMARAHADQSERLLVRRPISWMPWATAAAFLLVLAAALTHRGSATAFTVTGIVGNGAKVLDREAGRSHPVLGGMTLTVGDRVVTEPGSRVRLTSGASQIVLDEDSSVDIVAARRVMLDGGKLLAISPPTDLLVIADMANNSVRVTGRVELSLREVTGKVAGSVQVPGQDPVVPEPSVVRKKSLVARVQYGEVALDGDRDQRLRASAGQEGKFNISGQPETAPLKEPGVGTWADGLVERR